MAEYPEHNKLKAIAHFSQKIGEFLDWLEEQGIQLTKAHAHTDGCKNEEGRIMCGCHTDELLPIFESKQKLLARFFEIDENKLEDEKVAMLDHCRGEHRRQEFDKEES